MPHHPFPYPNFATQLSKMLLLFPFLLPIQSNSIPTYILEGFLKRREEPIAKRNTLTYLQIHSGTALPTIHFILLLILQRKEGGVGCLGEEPNPTTYNTTTYLLSTQNVEKILSFIMEYIDHKSVVLSSFTIWIHICILV